MQVGLDIFKIIKKSYFILELNQTVNLKWSSFQIKCLKFWNSNLIAFLIFLFVKKISIWSFLVCFRMHLRVKESVFLIKPVLFTMPIYLISYYMISRKVLWQLLIWPSEPTKSPTIAPTKEEVADRLLKEIITNYRFNRQPTNWKMIQSAITLNIQNTLHRKIINSWARLISLHMHLLSTYSGSINS